MRLPLLLPATVLALGSPGPAQQAGPSPVKVFIMAGQSCMVGQGVIEDAVIPGRVEYTVANDPEN